MKPIKVMAKQTSGGILDTQTVTVGHSGNNVLANNRYGYTTFGGTIGAISDGTSNIYGGASILTLDAEENASTEDFNVILGIAGNRSNSGWTSMTINGNVYLRVNASYSFNGTNSFWIWASVFSSPWPITGSMTPVVFN